MKERGKLKELVDPNLTFVDSAGVEWTAPGGTLTDGASVPRIALPLTDGRFDERFLKAAVIHDAYCQEENREITPAQYRTRPWRQVHRMFFEACVAGGTAPSLAKIMFAAVWWAGPRWNDRDPRLQDLSEADLDSALEASRRLIEEQDPTIDDIEAWMDRRESLALEVNRLQYNAIFERTPARSITLLRQAEALLARELGTAPDDLMLLTARGYVQKTWAIVYRRLRAADEAEAELDRAERDFERVLSERPDDASALNGLGSVWFLRNDLDRAEQYVVRALDLVPSYPAAEADLEEIRAARERRR